MNEPATARCCQVALSTMDLTRSHWWYKRALGFRGAGERRHREGPQFAAVPGLPAASFDVDCLVGGQEFFQFEMFEFAQPRMRSRPVDWRRCDIGYAAIGIHVEEFEKALARIDKVGGVLSAPMGQRGARRVCLADPDGTLLELMEDNPLGAGAGATPTVASVTLSVRDLGGVREFWVDVLGCEDSEVQLHDPGHERLWGLERAQTNALVLRSGDVLLEFVQYTAPLGRARPAGYMISDQGILNVAIGTADKREFDVIYGRAAARGFKGATEPWAVPGVATVAYLTDTQGFSVELLHVESEALGRMGFVPNDA